MSNVVFVNITAWMTDQVVDWLKGLDDVLHPYIPNFVVAGVTGKRLLCFTHHDLQRLQVIKLGHQELILEAIRLLTILHYELESENLQALALRLSCKAQSLKGEVGSQGIETLQAVNGNMLDHRPMHRTPLSVLTATSDLIATLKQLVSWLERPPFDNSEDYVKKRDSFVSIGMNLITAAQNDSLLHTQEHVMRNCRELITIADTLVTGSSDPLTIQPSSLELTTIRKKPEDELGMRIQSTYNGVHHIRVVEDQSPADLCGKIEEGDEVIQVNYQTVVGWQLKRLVSVIKENQKEVTLTLKKRPRHANPYGLHRNKRKNKSKLKQSTFPKSLRKSRDGSAIVSRSPLSGFLSAIPPPSEPFSESCRDDTDTDSDVFASQSESMDYQLDAKHRRATVSGGSPTLKRPSIRISEFSNSNRQMSEFANANRQPKSHTITVSSPSSDDGNSIGSPTSDSLWTPPGLDPQFKHTSRNDAPGDYPLHPRITQQLSDSSIYDSLDGSYISSATYSPPTPNRNRTERAERKFRLSESPKRRHASKMASREIAGDAKGPQLVRVMRVDSNARRERELRYNGSSRESSPGPGGEEGHQSYTVNIVAGVPQKIPNKSRDNSPGSPNSLLRKKTLFKRVEADLHHLVGQRRISCRDLGNGECQGWLWKKREAPGVFASKWCKRWFVLKNNNLYYYKDPEDLRAKGVIYMPGFQISPAPEIKSKKLAFKAHHSGTTFYFASERQEDMGKWMSKMGLSAIEYNKMSSNTTPTAAFRLDHRPDQNMYYSESDDEEAPKSQPSTPSAHTPSVSPGGSREDLSDHFCPMEKSIRRANLSFDGADKRKKRESSLTVTELLEVGKIQDVAVSRKLLSLERTLKDKENELAALYTFLSKDALTSADLQDFKHRHPMIIDRMNESSISDSTSTLSVSDDD